jgi:hypothetical protein
MCTQPRPRATGTSFISSIGPALTMIEEAGERVRAAKGTAALADAYSEHRVAGPIPRLTRTCRSLFAANHCIPSSLDGW